MKQRMTFFSLFFDFLGRPFYFFPPRDRAMGDIAYPLHDPFSISDSPATFPYHTSVSKFPLANLPIFFRTLTKIERDKMRPQFSHYATHKAFHKILRFRWFLGWLIIQYLPVQAHRHKWKCSDIGTQKSVLHTRCSQNTAYHIQIAAGSMEGYIATLNLQYTTSLPKISAVPIQQRQETYLHIGASFWSCCCHVWVHKSPPKDKVAGFMVVDWAHQHIW